MISSASILMDQDLPGVIAGDAIDILERLVAFDTTSAASNLALIGYVEDYLAEYGIASTRIANEAGTKANLLATIGPNKPGGVVLSGHTDVVPVTGQVWSSDPFELIRKDDRLFGRGSSDMKSFLALALATAPHLARRELSRPIHLAFTYDEEVGCLGAPDLIRALLARVAQPAAVIVGEPTGMDIVNSHKGMAIFEVIVTGREAHSSLVHEGVSANMAAIQILSVLADIAKQEEAQHSDPRFTPAWSTLTVGTLHGGTAPNILARECRFTFDLRSLPDRDAHEVLAPFWRAVEQTRTELKARDTEADIVVNELAVVPSLREEPEGKAEALATMISGSNKPGSAVSYGAEAGQFQAAGLSTVICGPGFISQAHKPDEYITVSQIEAGARFMARLAEYVANP